VVGCTALTPGGIRLAALSLQGKRIQQQFAAAEAEAAQQRQQQAGNGTHGTSGAPAAATAFVQQWNSQLLSRLQATPGVAGLHVMPIAGTSKRLALALAQQGAFAPAAWPLVPGGQLAGGGSSSSSNTAAAKQPASS
jgi:hypothetical protein